jgi:flagellar basal body-associated protein FliL
MNFASMNRYAAMARAFVQKDWFPSFALMLIMLITLVCAMFTFMLMPGLNQETAVKKTAEAAENEPDTRKANGGSGKGSQYALPELVTNVGTSEGKRFVVANLTLVGANQAFFKNNQDQIMDLSSGILARLNPDVLEKPSNRTMIKTELLTEFRRVLGGPYIKDIYFTRLAIQ